MKKFKSILLFALCLIMFSCEKTSIEKVVTVEEMKKIVSESIEINYIFKINNELLMIAKQRAIKISNNDQIISSSINQNSNLGNEIKQAKTRDDLRIVLNKLDPTNGDFILEKLEKQQILFKDFLAKNPEFLKFTDKEKIEILTISQKNYNKNSLNTTLSQFSKPVNQGLKTFNCLDDFQGDWNACQSSYDSSVFNIYVGVITTMGGGPVWGTAGIIGGTVMLVYAYNSWIKCTDNAGIDYSRCML